MSKELIDDIHQNNRSFSDALKVAKHINQKAKPIKYNRAQAILSILLSTEFLLALHNRMKNRVNRWNAANPKKKKTIPRLAWFLEWARGTGKSTIFALYIRRCMVAMPRGVGALVGASYQQILTRTLPATIGGLERQGLIKDIHYFVGRKPPASWGWPEAYNPPLRYDFAIPFYNGFTLVMISQDRKGGGSGRGLNTDMDCGDEAALLDHKSLQTDVWATTRGSFREMFQGHPLHCSRFYMSSTPLTSSGQWFTDMEQTADQEEGIYFLQAKARDNQFLPDSWFTDMEKMLDPWVYDAEIENIRPKGITDGFYPALNEDIHTYKDGFDYSYYDSQTVGSINVNCNGDQDLDPSQPLILGIDWGARINCLCVGQRKPQGFHFLNAMFVKGGKTLDDLLLDFDKYYKPHQSSNKTVYLYYCKEGNTHKANSRLTYAQQAAEELRKRGWAPVLMTQGQVNSSHSLRYKLWDRLLKEKERALPKIRFNYYNCRALIISMQNAPAKKGVRETIQKDKSSERSKKMKQEFATHFSDSADAVIEGLYFNLIGITTAFEEDSFSY